MDKETIREIIREEVHKMLFSGDLDLGISMATDRIEWNAKQSIHDRALEFAHRSLEYAKDMLENGHISIDEYTEILEEEAWLC